MVTMVQQQSSLSNNARNPASGNNGSSQNQSDTSLTKIFVGGLAWETKRDTMKKYFEQFGDIVEAVVIMDKNTGRSKGYGFVTFKEADAARKACLDPAPVIDGRRANCNLASLGASRSRPSPPLHGNRLRLGQHFQGISKSGVAPCNGGLTFPPPFHYPYQQGYPYSPFGFPAYPQDFSFAQGFYNPYLAPQFPQMFAGPAALYPHPQGVAGYSGSGYLQGPHVMQYNSAGLVATSGLSSQYGGVASVPNTFQNSGMPLTGGSSVAINRGAGQTGQAFAMSMPLAQYATVAAASEQTAT